MQRFCAYVAGLAIAAVATGGCGDGDDKGKTSARGQTTLSVTDRNACLKEKGVQIVPADTKALPVRGSGGKPPRLSGIDGTALRAGRGYAVAFVFKSTSEAASQAASLTEMARMPGVRAQGNVLMVVGRAFSPQAQDAVVECAGAPGSLPQEQPNAPALTRKALAECLEKQGPDVALNSGYKPVEGVVAVTVPFPDGSGFVANLWPYPTDAQADLAATRLSGTERRGNVLISFDRDPPAEVQRAVDTCVPR